MRLGVTCVKMLVGFVVFKDLCSSFTHCANKGQSCSKLNVCCHQIVRVNILHTFFVVFLVSNFCKVVFEPGGVLKIETFELN